MLCGMLWEARVNSPKKKISFIAVEAGLNYSGRQGVSDTGLRHLYILSP